MSRLLANYPVRITQIYKGSTHRGVDIVGNNNGNSSLDGLCSHSAGVVVDVQTGQSNNKGATGRASYGNFVKIKHEDGYYTLYAHMNSISVKINDVVTREQLIGQMGNTGNSYGGHLHFELHDTSDTYIDPTPYLEADLPTVEVKKNYQGYLDAVTESTISGWLWNGINDDAENVKIEIYKSAELVDTINILAADFRGDLLNAGKGDGQHGFNAEYNFAEKLGSGEYTIKAYTPENKPLSKSGKTLNVVKYVPEVEKTETTNTIDIGTTVKIKEGSTWASGKSISNWCFTTTMYVKGYNANGVVITKNADLSEVTGTIDSKNLIIL